MDEYKATFEIESKTDAYVVEQLMNHMYNSLREESKTIRAKSSGSTAMMEQFQAIRDATRQSKPGRLTVTLEQEDEEVEE